MDLSFLASKTVEHPTSAKLIIEPVAPLSMNVSAPGKYLKSLDIPTDEMVYAMLENALGWHFDKEIKAKFLKDLKIKKGDYISTRSGYISLLQFILKIKRLNRPKVKRHIDCWSSLKSGSTAHIGGAKNFDYSIYCLMEQSDKVKCTDTDKKVTHYHPENLSEALNGEEKVYHLNTLIEFFPMYYSSMVQREYIIPCEPYRYEIYGDKSVIEMIDNALNNPAAPLYIGTSDGWVDSYFEENINDEI